MSVEKLLRGNEDDDGDEGGHCVKAVAKAYGLWYPMSFDHQ